MAETQERLWQSGETNENVYKTQKKRGWERRRRRELRREPP